MGAKKSSLVRTNPMTASPAGMKADGPGPTHAASPKLAPTGKLSRRACRFWLRESGKTVLEQRRSRGRQSGARGCECRGGAHLAPERGLSVARAATMCEWCRRLQFENRISHGLLSVSGPWSSFCLPTDWVVRGTATRQLVKRARHDDAPFLALLNQSGFQASLFDDSSGAHAGRQRSEITCIPRIEQV